MEASIQTFAEFVTSEKQTTNIISQGYLEF